MRAAIMGSEGEIAAPGDEPGELLLAGPQLASGYWRDGALTNECFITLGGKRWYRSGDLARQDEDGCFHHLGRTDNQIKIMGHRVELEDIDMNLRKACGSDTAMAVAWPVEHGSALGIVAFVADSEIGVKNIRKAMKNRVPEYMIPRQFRFIDSLPLSSNGKFDRNALVELLKTENLRRETA
jgi:acyl-CoA synthetase (AMP-forming)/AMP-acid ligase II